MFWQGLCDLQEAFPWTKEAGSLILMRTVSGGIFCLSCERLLTEKATVSDT
jgi:hypothetical protein